MKPYAKYKDSGVEWVGKIPEHWDAVKLKRATQFLYGNSLSNENRIEGEVPVFGSNGITGYHNEAITEKPCIVIGRKGSFGKVNYSKVPCFPIDTTYYIDNTATKNGIRWLYYALQTLNLDSISKDSAVPGLSREDAYDKIALLPSIDEQQAIADFLDDKTAKIDKLVETKRRQIELLKEQRQAIINQAVTKGLDPNAPMKDSGIDWLGKIPKHWGVKKLKWIVSKIGSGVTPRGGAQVYQDEGVPLLRSQNVHFDGLRLDDVAYISDEIHQSMKNSQVNSEDVLLNITGASIGRCSVVPNSISDANVNQHVCILRPEASVVSNYLHLVIVSNVGQLQVYNSQNGTSREGLNFEQLGNFIIPLPSIDEQAEVTRKTTELINGIYSSINKAEKQIELLQEYRTTLISETVTGKIDVREAV